MMGVKLSDEGIATVQDLADRETEGNFSEMVRRLLSEAVAARQAKEQRRNDRHA
jgi:hypothetical protein